MFGIYRAFRREKLTNIAIFDIDEKSFVFIVTIILYTVVYYGVIVVLGQYVLRSINESHAQCLLLNR